MFCLLIYPFSGCEEGTTAEKEREILDGRRLEILRYANSQSCTGNSTCNYIGLGAKPCRGYWEYIVYSTAIDTTHFFQMIAQYNKDEDEYNRRWGITSDCEPALPPDSIACINGVCIGFWK